MPPPPVSAPPPTAKNFMETATKSFMVGITETEEPPIKSPDTKTEASPPNPPDKKEAPPIAPADKEKGSKKSELKISDTERTEIKQQIADGKWPRSAEQWEKYKAVQREEADRLTTELGTYQSKFKEAEEKLSKVGQPQAPADYEDIKKEREELSKQLQVAAVERHPKFKSYFENKTNAQLDLAKRIVGEEKSGRAVEILKLQDGQYKDAQIEEFIADLSPIAQSRFGSVLNAMSEINAERATEIQKASENYDAMIAEQQKSSETRKQTLQKQVNDVISLAQDKKEGIAIFQLKDGDENWNSEVTRRIEVAKNLMFGKNDPKKITTAALMAVAAPVFLQQAIEANQQIEKLTAQIASLTKAGPTIKGGQQETVERETTATNLRPNSTPQQASQAFFEGVKKMMEGRQS